MNTNQLAQKVKTLRKQKGLSQEALAGLAGLSLRTIQRLENENKNPSGDTLKRLSTALGVSPDYLIEWEPNENPNFLLIFAFSPILFIFNSFLAILVPLVLWLTKKNVIKGLKVLGIQVLKIETYWLVSFYIARTLNYFRLTQITRNKKSFVGDEWDSFLADVQTQSYLKTSFMVINICIILYLTYKTYKANHTKRLTLIS